jgi:glutamate-1-semialdehyde aminotransferase
MKFIEMGVMPEADAREPWFLCHAHTADVIDETLNIFKDAVWQVVKK